MLAQLLGPGRSFGSRYLSRSHVAGSGRYVPVRWRHVVNFLRIVHQRDVGAVLATSPIHKGIDRGDCYCRCRIEFSCVYWQTYVALGTSWGTLVGGVFRVAYSFFLGVLLFRIHPRWVLPRLSPLVLFIGLPMVLFIRLPPYAQLMLALFVLPWFVLLGARVEPKGSSMG